MILLFNMIFYFNFHCLIVFLLFYSFSEPLFFQIRVILEGNLFKIHTIFEPSGTIAPISYGGCQSITETYGTVSLSPPALFSPFSFSPFFTTPCSLLTSYF